MTSGGRRTRAVVEMEPAYLEPVLQAPAFFVHDTEGLGYQFSGGGYHCHHHGHHSFRSCLQALRTGLQGPIYVLLFHTM